MMAEPGKTTHPIEDSYWVIPGRLLAGEYPGDHQEDDARAKARWLLYQGISFWLDLTEDGEHGLVPYGEILLEEAKALGLPAAHVRMPVRDMGVPDRQTMVRILDVLDASLKAQQTVYLHCFGGIGRTGTVVGCFIARHGITGSEAIEQIARWRQGTPDGWKQSPETDEQVELILSWKEGE